MTDSSIRINIKTKSKLKKIKQKLKLHSLNETIEKLIKKELDSLPPHKKKEAK